MVRPKHPKFPDILRVMRARRFASAFDLDDACGFAHTTVAQYENGLREPGLVNLERLADALGVTADELLGRKPKPKKP